MPIYFRKSSTRIILHVSLSLDSALWGSITDRNCPIFNDFGADFLWGGNMFSKWLVEVAQMSINGKWLNRLKIIHIMEKLLSYKREWTTDACQELRQREEIRQKKNIIIQSQLNEQLNLYSWNTDWMLPRSGKRKEKIESEYLGQNDFTLERWENSGTKQNWWMHKWVYRLNCSFADGYFHII